MRNFLIQALILGAAPVLISVAQAGTKPIWSGKVDGFLVTWTGQDLKWEKDGKLLKSLLSEYRRDRDCDDEDAGYDNTSYEVRSIVGPLISYKTSTGGFWGGAHPYAWNSIETYRMADGKQVSLTDYFSDAQLLKALTEDKFLISGIEARKGKKDQFKTLKELFDFFESHHADSEDPTARYAVNEFMLKSFAFVDYKDGKVGIRIGLYHVSEAERGAYTEIGIRLPAPETLKAVLEKARNKTAGFLMKYAPRGVTDLSVDCTKDQGPPDPNAPPVLKFMRKKFTLNKCESGKLCIKSKLKEIVGVNTATYGNFSTWKFQGEAAQVLEVIAGKPETKIINVDDGEDVDNSATPLGASPDGNFLAIDRGSGPGLRGIEIRSVSGEKVFSDGYLDRPAIKPRWNGTGFEYLCTTELKIDGNAETKKCESVGQAVMAEWCVYDVGLRQKKKLPRPGTVECTN